MGKALLTLTKKMHLGGTCFDSLTQGKALQFQNYYRGAVMNNIGDVGNMTNAKHFIIEVALMRIHSIINALQEVKVGAFISRP